MHIELSRFCFSIDRKIIIIYYSQLLSFSLSLHTRRTSPTARVCEYVVELVSTDTVRHFRPKWNSRFPVNKFAFHATAHKRTSSLMMVAVVCVVHCVAQRRSWFSCNEMVKQLFDNKYIMLDRKITIFYKLNEAKGFVLEICTTFVHILRMYFHGKCFWNFGYIHCRWVYRNYILHPLQN